MNACLFLLSFWLVRRLPSTGQIAASLAALSRTIEDYDSMAKKEMVSAKQEKALMCVKVVVIGGRLNSFCGPTRRD